MNENSHIEQPDTITQERGGRGGILVRDIYIIERDFEEEEHAQKTEAC